MLSVTNANRFAAPPCCPVCGTRTCMPYVCDPGPMPAAQAREILGRRLDERVLLQRQFGGWLRAHHAADAAGDFEAAARAADHVREIELQRVALDAKICRLTRELIAATARERIAN